MNNLNSVLIEGNLVKDPERSVLEKGTILTKFTIAVNRMRKEGQEKVQDVMYILIETWGKLAENCAQYLHKGEKVRVVGYLKQSRWTDGDKYLSRYSINSEHVEFISNKKNPSQSPLEYPVLGATQGDEEDAEFAVDSLCPDSGEDVDGMPMTL